MRFLAAALVLLASVTAHAQGRLAFASEAHAFETLDEGEVGTTTFAFTNTGDAPLRLTQVTPSCGCTTPQYPTGAIAPGATGEIEVAYHSEGRPGPFEKHVTVVADGAEPRVVTLTITGDVTPGFARLGDRQGALVFEHGVFAAEDAPAAVQHAFRFQNTGTLPLRIESVETTAGQAVQVVYPDRPVFSQDVAVVMVMIDDMAAIARPDGRFDVGITLHTTDADQPVKSLRLHGTVASAGR